MWPARNAAVANWKQTTGSLGRTQQLFSYVCSIAKVNDQSKVLYMHVYLYSHTHLLASEAIVGR